MRYVCVLCLCVMFVCCVCLLCLRAMFLAGVRFVDITCLVYHGLLVMCGMFVTGVRFVDIICMVHHGLLVMCVMFVAGVRFVDITCMVHHGLLVMCHGLRKFGRLLKLLMDTAEFLRRNPSETVLVHLNIQSPLQRTKFLEWSVIIPANLSNSTEKCRKLS